MSKQALEEQPWCQCGARTTQDNHILSIKDRPDLRLERSNLVGRGDPGAAPGVGSGGVRRD